MRGKTPFSFIKAPNGIGFVSVGALSQLLPGFYISLSYKTRLAEVEIERKSPKWKFNGWISVV